MGEIKSPNRPCHYGGGQHCVWSIRPNTSFPTKEIWMFFAGFSRLEVYEDSPGCRCVGQVRLLPTRNRNYPSNDCILLVL